jgi:hypothetical protein
VEHEKHVCFAFFPIRLQEMIGTHRLESSMVERRPGS